MTFTELAEHLVRAAYLADGGELPAHELHYRAQRRRYGRIVAGMLRALADNVTPPASYFLRALAEEVTT